MTKIKKTEILVIPSIFLFYFEKGAIIIYVEEEMRSKNSASDFGN